MQDIGAIVKSFGIDGYVIVPGFMSAAICDAMESRVLELVEDHAANLSIGDALVVEEASLAGEPDPRLRLSKLFRVHRDETVFRQWSSSREVVDIVTALIGPNIDCFLSQFIFKYPGALGQPWHQDRFYFNFDRSPQIGVWIAVTEAHETNGPLWVLPGSHREAVHEAVADTRVDANPFYVEIVDHDMSGAKCVLMQAGDALFFHSHLMHKSTDNLSDDKRAAMVFHYAEAQTVDLNRQKFGRTAPNMDWVPVART
jgi:phytanoyl-CoA hydroxylase